MNGCPYLGRSDVVKQTCVCWGNDMLMDRWNGQIEVYRILSILVLIVLYYFNF